MSNSTRTLLIVLAVLVLSALILAGYGVGQYNRAVSMDENVKAHWAQVDNQLQRRYDLIPNLVATVKGYAKHERELFENIAESRTKYFRPGATVTDKIDASNRLEGAISRLLLLQEQYPQLKANESFLKLQDSIEGTENRLSVERQRYNESVQQLNSYRRTVMGRFFSALAGVGEAPYYRLPEGRSETPKVEF